jgi:hypothetical protein
MNTRELVVKVLTTAHDCGYSDHETEANSILAQLNRDGLAIVPREPTTEMHIAGEKVWTDGAIAVWAAMLAAAARTATS